MQLSADVFGPAVAAPTLGLYVRKHWPDSGAELGLRPAGNVANRPGGGGGRLCLLSAAAVILLVPVFAAACRSGLSHSSPASMEPGERLDKEPDAAARPPVLGTAKTKTKSPCSIAASCQLRPCFLLFHLCQCALLPLVGKPGSRRFPEEHGWMSACKNRRPPA